jgi:hypothetical protein
LEFAAYQNNSKMLAKKMVACCSHHLNNAYRPNRPTNEHQARAQGRVLQSKQESLPFPKSKSFFSILGQIM